MQRLVLLFLLAFALWSADLSGKWEFSVETSAGSGTPTFELQQKGDTLSGTYAGALGNAEVKGFLKGEDLELRFEVGGNQVVYTGKLLKDGTLKGNVDIAGQANGTWTGKRVSK